MRFQSIKRRLRAIAETRGGGGAQLTFADGSTRSLKVRSRNGQLKLCLDAFAKMRSYPPATPEGVPRLSPPAESRTANDQALELLGRAESCEGPRFLQFIHGLARTVHERRSQKGAEAAGENAPIVQQEK
jgi:hypothetical protein